MIAVILAATLAWAMNIGLRARWRARSAARAGPPNVILILTDDLGYGDLGCQGARLPTPRIDSIAREGVRFADAYATAPVCSPSRAGLLTGKYQQRFGHEFNGEFSRRLTDGLPVSERTLADELKTRGYATACVGKWHLGVGESFHPTRRGFDEFFGFLGGSHSYQDSQKNRGQIMRGTSKVDEPAYLTEAFTREAIDFVKRKRERPFFLYLSYNAVHTPMEAPGRYRRDAAKVVGAERAAYGGMILSLDEQVGRLLDALKDLGLDRKTVVIFASDNGGRPAFADNGGLSGGKHELSDGGIRVPLLMRWPGTVAPGGIRQDPVSLLDVHATALRVAGAEPTGDGIDLKSAPQERRLFWRQGELGAVRDGKWKLLREGTKTQLFDLDADVVEQRDIAGDNPAIVERLNREFESWSAGLARPLWREPRRTEGDVD